MIGPRLKEMAHLAHTEYELRGRSSLDVREVLKETMFAATTARKKLLKESTPAPPSSSARRQAPLADAGTPGTRL